MEYRKHTLTTFSTIQRPSMSLFLIKAGSAFDVKSSKAGQLQRRTRSLWRLDLFIILMHEHN